MGGKSKVQKYMSYLCLSMLIIIIGGFLQLAVETIGMVLFWTFEIGGGLLLLYSYIMVRKYSNE
ncbi:hypothetical protein [Pontibacillus yanchengensis]|uniref:Uncharacterized protein n=1 Tax=Pontibacillus yanchengensis Y32 TaxID=1385514 RepID=A0A0A2TGH4_9BACI|nr:hypothetical protein [Pontibacillus yanchengensis]KGP74669.1 hypothetical protein N782_00245 [Pontibacillus yanchengensis Y32]